MVFLKAANELWLIGGAHVRCHQRQGSRCHLSDKIGGFSDNLPRCQARSADQVSRIYWRCIDSGTLDAHQRLIVQLRAKLCLHKNHAALGAASERYAPCYTRNLAHLSLSSKGLNR